MPRASNIYIFLDERYPDEFEPPAAVFTVKYEAINWAKKNGFYPESGRSFWRLRDGGDWSTAVNLTSELYDLLSPTSD